MRVEAERLDAAVATLAAAGVETARSDAEWLLADTLEVPRMRVRLALTALSATQAERFESAIRRRAAREPLQQILGWEEFAGVRLGITDAVMVPRPETEVLAVWALELLPPARRGTRVRVIDLGTGSGCLACSIARARPDVDVVAIDVSPAAAAVGWRNARSLGLADRVRVVASDLLAGLRPFPVDLIVSNPPYLPSEILRTLPPEVTEHEPRLALDGGPDGLAVVRRIVATSAAWLRPGGGAVALETAGDDQTHVAAGLLADAGFVGVATRRDLAGVARHIAGRTPPGQGMR